MPRRSSGPRLWFDKSRQTWTIVDGRKRSRTGFGADETKRAKEALGHYLANQHTVDDTPDPLLSDVLSHYADERLAGKISETSILYDIAHLTKWWGTKCVSEVTSTNTKAYAAHRNGAVSARRELAFLGAAMKCWHVTKKPLKALPSIELPPAPDPRSHWMTREQAAQFLWHARKTPHLCRFFIIGWYTGSRRGVICGLRWDMINFKTKIMHRKPPGAIQAKNKKAPPVRMGERLMAHLKRWKRMDGKGVDYVIRYQGKPIKRPTRVWDETRTAAGLPDYITPHILRHSRATNMMQQGKDPWQSAKALGMSLEMLTRVYGHHHPDWQKDVSETR